MVQVERTHFKYFYVDEDDFFLVIIYLILITYVVDFHCRHKEKLDVDPLLEDKLP